MWCAHVGLSRLHVQERCVDGQRGDGRGHVDPHRVSVRVLRLLDDRLFDRAVGDDWRSVPATNPGNDRWRVNVRRPFQHIHRAADVPDVSGLVNNAGHVCHVRHYILTEPVFLLLLLSGN